MPRPNPGVPFIKRLALHFQGWRGSILAFSITAWVLLAANLAVSIYMSTQNSGGGFGSSITLSSGPCKEINNTKAWIQVVTNAASMALLAATNFAMQAWTSLSREELDQVHRNGETADIGIPSLRNIARIKVSRQLLWGIVFLFTIPVHLIYNSTLYTSSSASDYTVFIVSKELFDQSFVTAQSDPGVYSVAVEPSLYTTKEDNEWERLSLTQILDRYGTGFPDEYRSVVLVAESSTGLYNRSSPSNGFLYQAVMKTWGPTPQNRWLCDLFDVDQIEHDRATMLAPPNATCRAQNVAGKEREVWEVNLDDLSTKTETGGWLRGGGHTAVLQPWGLSEKTELDCRVLSSPVFWWLITICNFVIAGLITGMVFFYKSTPLVTVGDVIDSYLCTPSSEISSAASTYDYTSFKNIHRPKLEPRAFEPKKKRLWRAVGGMRWGITLAWWLAALFVIAAGFTQTWRAEREYADTSMASIFARGFDSLRRVSMILPSDPANTSSTARRLQLTILANLPQFAMVATYLLYNSLLTIMVVELEFHSFSKKTVQNPPSFHTTGRTALDILPRLTLSSLFFAEVDLWDEKGERYDGEGSILTLGYSNLALFWLLFVGILAWLPVVGMGCLRRLPEGGMPLLGACSGVVAAACHLPPAGAERDGDGVAAGRVSWGVVEEMGVDGSRRRWLGFSGVAPMAVGPVVGEKYG
ncbi:hypothetical protein QBC34DRAFT_443662 [Podospora aff. communis PSN243]|uniref:DUF6536 domain-containing protein n=1 Tax=Podospora aff. communis PSN243 TaxID=3040156 RepID=A0AAV9G5E9_9PEZI|nr:hypothetical protein QBC34DRAFT_443662 [Podospora aff. communis PSN243]